MGFDSNIDSTEKENIWVMFIVCGSGKGNKELAELEYTREPSAGTV